jgi:hypothetical protein
VCPGAHSGVATCEVICGNRSVHSFGRLSTHHCSPLALWSCCLCVLERARSSLVSERRYDRQTHAHQPTPTPTHESARHQCNACNCCMTVLFLTTHRTRVSFDSVLIDLLLPGVRSDHNSRLGRSTSHTRLLLSCCGCCWSVSACP